MSYVIVLVINLKRLEIIKKDSTKVVCYQSVNKVQSIIGG